MHLKEVYVSTQILEMFWWQPCSMKFLFFLLSILTPAAPREHQAKCILDLVDKGSYTLQKSYLKFSCPGFLQDTPLIRANSLLECISTTRSQNWELGRKVGVPLAMTFVISCCRRSWCGHNSSDTQLYFNCENGKQNQQHQNILL